MGGGDLNSKKSWHPNTMKNQERVWKAEKAAADEEKRISELRKERAEERDRAELNNMIKNASNVQTSDRLHWMYDKPDKKVQEEDYLLGKAVDAGYEKSRTSEPDIPAVARRVVGSSMLATAGDVQVDLARKVREDPLLLVKERERAARAALLNNPLQRRRLTELLRKEQEQRKDKKSKKQQKNDIDEMLNAKLSALGGGKNIDIATLLASCSDSSSDEDEKKKKKKAKKAKKKSKKSKKSKESLLSSIDKVEKRDSMTRGHGKKNVQRSLPVETGPSTATPPKRRRKEDERQCHRIDGGEGGAGREFQKRQGEAKSRGSSAERAARLAEMAAAGAERERDRARRVQLRPATPPPRHAAPRHNLHLPDSLEARLHSNRHYIQRDAAHMQRHFARR